MYISSNDIPQLNICPKNHNSMPKLHRCTSIFVQDKPEWKLSGLENLDEQVLVKWMSGGVSLRDGGPRGWLHCTIEPFAFHHPFIFNHFFLIQTMSTIIYNRRMTINQPINSTDICAHQDTKICSTHLKPVLLSCQQCVSWEPHCYTLHPAPRKALRTLPAGYPPMHRRVDYMHEPGMRQWGSRRAMRWRREGGEGGSHKGGEGGSHGEINQRNHIQQRCSLSTVGLFDPHLWKPLPAKVGDFFFISQSHVHQEFYMGKHL